MRRAGLCGVAKEVTPFPLVAVLSAEVDAA